jgi:hypothetical protein
MGRLQQRTWTAEDGSAGHRRGRSRRAGVEPALGDDDHDQNHEEPGAVASSTSEATSGTRVSSMLAFRSVQQGNHCAREEFLYELKAGPAGGRLRQPSSAGSIY